MFKRINTSTAKLYRRAIISGINQARSEFNYGHFLKIERVQKQESISDTVKFMNVEAKAYVGEKRKHGWVSQPKETSGNGNGVNPALIAAISAF